MRAARKPEPEKAEAFVRHNGSKRDTLREAGTSSAILRACAVMQCFPRSQGARGVREIAEACKLSTTTAHRILKSLVEGGLLERRSGNLYGRCEDASRAVRYRFGYAAQTEENSFARLVTESIRSHAYSNGIELVLADNHYSATSALRNAKLFAREKVDVAIEFQTHEGAAPRIAATLHEAQIPVIAIEIPHPGAFYYGANNFRAGAIAGKALAQACLSRWKGEVDQIVLLSQPIAGSLPQTRLDGTVASLREMLPKATSEMIRVVDGKGRFETSLSAIRRFLRVNSPRRLLVSGVNDPSCLGALQALVETGRQDRCLIVGQNGSIEARLELRKPNTPYIGSVAYFPEKYGEAVINLALSVLEQRNPPPATFVHHQLLTKDNVDNLYPNDEAVSRSFGDDLLINAR